MFANFRLAPVAHPRRIKRLEPTYFQKLLTDEVELLQFATRYLKQVLFGENSIAEKPDAIEKRKKRRQEIMAKQREQMQKDMEKEIDSPE